MKKFFEDLLRDSVFAIRVWGMSPGFTITVLLSLALGIGACSTIYSFMDAIMVRALPVSSPGNLVILNWQAKGWPKVVHSQHGDGYKAPGGITGSGTFPYPFYQSLRADRNSPLSAVFAFADAGRLNLIARDQSFLGRGEYVSGNYFSVLGVPPSSGRPIDDEDDQSGANAVAVISFRVWQQIFGGTPGAIGQTIVINRVPVTIVGVARPDFRGVNPRYETDIFLPLRSMGYINQGTESWFRDPYNYWLNIMGRNRPGLAPKQIESPLAGKFAQFLTSNATTDRERTNLPILWLEDGGSGLDSLRREYSSPLFILAAMSGLILLIACCNIANLMLSRFALRTRELAVRLSLGARRSRIFRQLLTENLLIGLIGGLIGLGVSEVGVRLLTWLLESTQPDLTFQAAIDYRVYLFAVSVSVLCSTLFGLAPAFRAVSTELSSLRESRVAAHLGRNRRFFGFRLTRVLIAGQVALSLLLVVASGLFLKTLVRLQSVPLGFNAEKLLVFTVDASQAGYDLLHSEALYEELRQRFATIPGVQEATMSDMLLVTGSANGEAIKVPGIPSSRDHRLSTSVALVGPSFFSTMQIPILNGRPISAADTASAPRAAVVNEVFVKRFFAGRNAIGAEFEFDDDKPITVQIVGIAKNTLFTSIKAEIPPVAYVPYSQPPPYWPMGPVFYSVRASGDPLALANTVRQITKQADLHVPVTDLTTQVHYIESTIAPERALAMLCTTFGFIALAIACIGIFGTTSYAVVRRTNEIGIRIALGAKRSTVLWMVQREVLISTIIGLSVGALVAWNMARLVSSYLFGVHPDDIFTFSFAAVALFSCAVIASCMPARRATRIEPMEALRTE